MIKIGLVVGILLFGLILYEAFVPSPTIAGECVTPEQYEQMVNAHGDKIAGSVKFSGDHTDSLLVIQGSSLIAIVGFKNGCLVTNIIPLDSATPPSSVQPGASKSGTGA